MVAVVVVVAACGRVWLCCWDFELFKWMMVCAAHKCQGVWLARHIAGVFRCAGCIQKSLVDRKGKSLLDFYTFSKNTDGECSCHVVLSSTRQHDDQLTLNTTT